MSAVPGRLVWRPTALPAAPGRLGQTAAAATTAAATAAATADVGRTATPAGYAHARIPCLTLHLRPGGNLAP